jgi:hypothetical protein
MPYEVTRYPGKRATRSEVPWTSGLLLHTGELSVTDVY